MTTKPSSEVLPDGFDPLPLADDSDPATAEIRAALPSVLPGLRHLFAMFPDAPAKPEKREKPSNRRPRPKGDV